jgi:hypothetical protein
VSNTGTCFSSIKGLRMRATRLTSIGKWATGTTASAVSAGFVSIALKDNIESGSEYKQKNASGDFCINERDRDLLNWIELEIAFCSVDPELVELITGQRVLHDQAVKSVGFTKANVVPTDFALEVWTKVGGGGVGNHQWVYWLLPHVTNGWFSDITLEDGTATFSVKCNTAINQYWGKGPYNVVAADAQLTPGPLTTEPVLATEHLYTRLTEIAPPAVACGYVTQTVPWS